jgi:hypothetical protein
MTGQANRRRAPHASRSWDCPCGKRVWGNGGKASHKWACVVAMQEEVDANLAVHEHLRTFYGRWERRYGGETARWQTRLNERVELEMKR